MNRLKFSLPVLAIVFLLGCEESPTEIAGDTAALFKKGGNKPGGGGGGGSQPADPAIAYRARGALRVMNADGSNSTIVVPDGEFFASPSWAPFGEGTSTDPYRIVYSSELCGPLATVDVFVVNGSIQASSARTIVTSTIADCENYPVWSPDGVWIAYTIETTSLGVIQAGIEQPTATILYSGPSSGAVFSPAWSPDADAIAFSEWDGSEFALKIYHVSDGAVTTVVGFGEYMDPLNLDWSRSSTDQRLAFQATRVEGRKRVATIYTVAIDRDDSGHYVDGGTPEPLVGGSKPTWSPDDSRLAIDGIKLVDVESRATTSLNKGAVMAAWKR